MRRRNLSTFSLSFIDSVLCGFGSVVLLFLIINSQSVAYRDRATRDLSEMRAELEGRLLHETKNALGLKRTLEDLQQEIESLRRQQISLQEQLDDRRGRLDRSSSTEQGRDEALEALKSDLRAKQAAVERLRASVREATDQGRHLRPFPGEGDRQYLTDLKIGGDHILILVDASASMLGQSIVDVIRRRNLSPADKQRSAKWRRTLEAVDWLSAQMPATSRFQIMAFNETAWAVAGAKESRWLDASDPHQVDNAVDALRRLTPDKGTSLLQAAAAMRGLQPRPDNVFLLTDGLPTQGAERGWRKNVSGKERLKLFRQALKEFPTSIPVNIILYPMEGDPDAAAAFWQLAQRTNGSFFSPSKDWP